LFIGAGGTGAALYVLYLALLSHLEQKEYPRTQKKLNPSDKYMFYSVNVDYSKLKKEGPDF
ncbi:hypothetical protein DBR06_SOUSAS35810003, partial [Sousa chinensis]